MKYQAILFNNAYFWLFILNCVGAQEAISPKSFLEQIAERSRCNQGFLAEKGNFKVVYHREPGGKMQFISTQDGIAFWVGEKLEKANYARVRGSTGSFWFSVNENGRRQLNDYQAHSKGLIRPGYSDLEFSRCTSGSSVFFDYIPIVEIKLKDIAKFLQYSEVNFSYSDELKKLTMVIAHDKLATALEESLDSSQNDIDDRRLLASAARNGLNKIVFNLQASSENRQNLEVDCYFNRRTLKEGNEDSGNSDSEYETVTAAMRVSWEWDMNHVNELPIHYAVSTIDGFQPVYESFLIDRIEVEEVAQKAAFYTEFNLASFGLIVGSRRDIQHSGEPINNWSMQSILGISTAIFLLGLFLYFKKRNAKCETNID